jgi:hypothetical protein
MCHIDLRHHLSNVLASTSLRELYERNMIDELAPRLVHGSYR